MTAIVAWLLGSKLGRYAALALLVVSVIGIAMWRARMSGVEAERMKQLQRALEQLRLRVKVDDEIAKLAPDERLVRLSRWVRD